MISQQQFIFLIEGLKEQSEFENKFNECFNMLNTSYTVVELSFKLNNSVFKVLEEDFSATGIDVICDYLYGEKTEFTWDEREDEFTYSGYKYQIDSVSDLYEMLYKHFKLKNEE